MAINVDISPSNLYFDYSILGVSFPGLIRCSVIVP